MTDLPVPPKAEASDVAPIASGGVPIEVKIEVGQVWQDQRGALMNTIRIVSVNGTKNITVERLGVDRRWIVEVWPYGLLHTWITEYNATLISPTNGNQPVEVP